MTPAARVAAAIELLDAWRQGARAEAELTAWARRSRFAGSKDRAAVRDHVYDALRRWRSAAAMGGAETGRAVLLGLMRQQSIDPQAIFTGEGHAPAPLTNAELAAGRTPEGAESLDLPDWIWPIWRASLGSAAEPCAEALRHRAPVTLRVNTLKATTPEARARLAEEGIETAPVSLCDTALDVTVGARKLRHSSAYGEGLVELQDAASQAVIASIPISKGMKVLDFCAGGGGKALALAARSGGPVDVHDAAPERMRDLPARAKRAGADLRITSDPAPGAYDIVLADAPCSGAGSWRRDPEGKWRLTEARLAALTKLQDEVLDAAAARVAEGGLLAYATCSLLAPENDARVTAFLDRHADWHVGHRRLFTPETGADGFFVAHLHSP